MKVRLVSARDAIHPPHWSTLSCCCSCKVLAVAQKCVVKVRRVNGATEARASKGDTARKDETYLV